jgi:hypothetical protein
MARGPHHSHNPGHPLPATCGGGFRGVRAKNEERRRKSEEEWRRRRTKSEKKKQEGLPEVGESGKMLESRGGELTLAGIDRQVDQVRQLGHELAL